MTGTFWDTIVVCTITGLCIASSGVLGMTDTTATGTYTFPTRNSVEISSTVNGKTTTTIYDVTDGTPSSEEDESAHIVLTPQKGSSKDSKVLELHSDEVASFARAVDSSNNAFPPAVWEDASHNQYIFSDGTYQLKEIVSGSALTIAAFKTVLGKPGGWLVCISIALFAFSTILGWEYHGEKAFEYLFGTHKYNMVYRIVFSLIVYIGATTTLQIAWNFSDIANALMAIPNLICLLALNGVIVSELNRFQAVIKNERNV